MQKVNTDFVRIAFSGEGSVREYASATSNISLWASEQLLFKKYFDKDDFIIDIGCGTGRVTHGLSAIGYNNIIGLDLSEKMLDEARRLNEINGNNITFTLGDATALPYKEDNFDGAIFAFNGLMQIPWHCNRIKALHEIFRVLKPQSVFIFTTHDREADKKHSYYWNQEIKLWESGKQNPRLPEFGDLLYKSYDREMYVHVPTRDEIMLSLQESGFELIKDSYRPEIAEESEEVKEFSDECRFWVVRKP